ncbi:MAG: MOSC domain-containing protein [Gemmatimonadota bacterium]|nr:MOSC domain-containing protein [Gemmatimonadota bacterium]
MVPPGRIEAIWIKRARRGPMDSVDRARLVSGEGIATDANFGRSRRQVTVIEHEVFERIREDLPDADPSMRRANVMVRGVRLRGTRGRTLSLGGVRLWIRGETRPCERMDLQCPGLTQALATAWNGGVYAVVLDDGEIAVGDEAHLGPVITPE